MRFGKTQVQRIVWLAAAASAALNVHAQRANAVAAISLASPNGKLVAEIKYRDGATPQFGGPIELNVSLNGKPVLTGGGLGITVDGVALGATAFLPPSVASDQISETYPVFGGHSTATNRAATTKVTLKSGDKSWQIELRVFDDGVAYRYFVLGQGKRRVTGEASGWTVPENSTIFFQQHNNRKDYESMWQKSSLADLTAKLTPKPPAPSTRPAPAPQPAMTVAAPITVQLPDQRGYVVLTEANLVNYSDMGLKFDGTRTFNAYFHNDPDGFDLDGDIVTPWRVAIVSEDLNGLVNTDLIHNLCPPPSEALAKADWIKPGRAIWHWMVSGRPAFADQKQWVDWTSAVGFEYYLIDDGWKRWNTPGADGAPRDMWACMKEVVDYATTKNVGIWAWVDSKDIHDHDARKAYFEKAASIGIKGVKIDFMKAANVEWVKWYDDTIQDAAAAHVMLDFHGSLIPKGRERTYPHELTRESVRGRENGKQSGLHDTILPFTRMVQGPTDYTPTDFRTSTTDPKQDKLKGSSYAHELSMAIVFTSPFFCYGGSPADYLQNPCIDILKTIPATWDETVVLPGSDIGEVAAFARRKGDTWFVAVLNGSTARKLPIALSFLKDGKYKIDKLSDSDEKFDAVVKASGTVARGDSLDVELRKDGGFVARLTRE